MLIKQLNEDGEEVEIEVFTQEEAEALAAEKAEAEAERLKAEHEAAIAEKDEHLKKKTDEFVKGKKGVSQKEEELNAKIAEAERLANEAVEKVTKAEEAKNNSIKRLIMNNLVGEDKELREKLNEAYDLVNLDIETPEDIQKRMQFAAGMIGLQNVDIPAVEIGGGVPPDFSKKREETLSEEDHTQWRNELGLPDLTQEK